MTLNIGPLRLPLVATILVLAGLYLLTSLGRWQWARAEEKRQVLATMESRQTMQPISLEQLDQQVEQQYFHVRLKGEFDQQHYLLLDNRILNGQPGFEVIQPLRQAHRTILVNRGWIPWPVDRSQLPKIPALMGEQDVTGIVYQAGESLVLREDQLSATASWPQLIQALDMQKLTALYDGLGLHIEPWVLRQDPDSDNFYQRQWQYVNMPPERHISYAVTWFGLAIALIIIYIAALIRMKEK